MCYLDEGSSIGGSNGSKVSELPWESLILSRLVPCSSWTEYSHALPKKLLYSSSRLRADSEHDSSDPSMEVREKPRLPSDFVYEYQAR